MVIVANAATFGGEGPYSARGARQLRMVGRRTWPVSEIRIKQVTGGKRQKGNGMWLKPIEPPYMPESIGDLYHPTGNSLGYTIQTAHLMGCNPIYALGFTLQAGTGYFFGRKNPVTQHPALYDANRALDWLRWYEQSFPGRVRLLPGWAGPIYDVFRTESLDDYQATLERSRHGSQAVVQGEAEPDAGNQREDADAGFRFW